MTSQVRPVCDCLEPCACYTVGKDKALQTAVTSQEIDHNDPFDR